MDIDKVRAMTDLELEEALRQAKQDLWSARFELATRQLKDYSTIPQTRRTIARILTVQHRAQASAATALTEPADDQERTRERASGRRRSAASSATRWTRRSSCPSSAWRATGSTSASSA